MAFWTPRVQVQPGRFHRMMCFGSDGRTFQRIAGRTARSTKSPSTTAFFRQWKSAISMREPMRRGSRYGPLRRTSSPGISWARTAARRPTSRKTRQLSSPAATSSVFTGMCSTEPTWVLPMTGRPPHSWNPWPSSGRRARSTTTRWAISRAGISARTRRTIPREPNGRLSNWRGRRTAVTTRTVFIPPASWIRVRWGRTGTRSPGIPPAKVLTWTSGDSGGCGRSTDRGRM